ncbi:MAG: hypothetical protein R3F59_04450 [Myxococcota bacterium]
MPIPAALAFALAAAAAPDPEPTGTIEIPQDDEPLPSAIDTMSGDPGDDVDPDALLRLPRRTLVRSRFSVHPLATWTSVLGGHGSALWLGAGLGHQLFPVDEVPLHLGLDTRLEVTAPVGGASGLRVDLRSALCPWFGRLGLSLGPTLRVDREIWALGQEVPLGVLLGAELGVVVDAGLVQPRLAVAPAGIVAGAPRDPRDPVLPTLLDQTTWRAGLGFDLHPLQVGLEAALRESSAGPTLEAGVALHLLAF